MLSDKLIIVLPVYNEEANIVAVIGEWETELARLGAAHEFLAINDGSRDGTGAALRSLAQRLPALTVIDRPNAGHGRACRVGYDFAAASDAAWTLQIDSDGQCDPRHFESFWHQRAEADCLFGLRTRRDDGAMRSLISTGCRLMVSLLCGSDLKDANVPYRLLRTSALRQALAKIPPDFNMQNVALTVVLKRDSALRWRYLPIHFRCRQGGTNSIDLPRILAMGWELVLNLRRLPR